MRFLPFLIATVLLFCSERAVAQPVDPDLKVYYTTARSVTLFHVSDSTKAYIHLRLREPVYVIEDESLDFGRGWKKVRTMDGANGMVRSKFLSNVWIRISKTQQTLFAYRGANLIARMATDLGYNFFSDKERRGSRAKPDEWRTPEGKFFVASKNQNSQFYKALVLNYPNAEDADRGLRDSLINREQYLSIVLAEKKIAMPPMDTDLGGWIEIHGNGTGQRKNWTQGCIAVQNVELDRLWDIVEIGTPVLIDP